MLVFGLWTLIAFCFAGQLYLSRAKIGDPVSWGFALGRSLADWYIFAVLSLPTLWLARRFRIERTHWQKPLAIHLAGSFLFTLCWMALRAGLEVATSRFAERPVAFEEAFSHALVATFFFNLLIYWAIVSISHGLAYYAKFQEREIRAAELEKSLTEARLQALQMQLNPHFLFNTLHAISALMHKDVEAADRMISRLSELLRYALESTGEQVVPLRQELEFLERYLEIEKTRFGSRLEVRKEIAPETLDALVPNLALQPIVENAIQHGIEPHARPGVILLRAGRENNSLVLQVCDNGSGLGSKRSFKEGIGLSNTRARLEQLYPGQHALTWSDAVEGGLVVKMVVPWKLVGGALSITERKNPQ